MLLSTSRIHGSASKRADDVIQTPLQPDRRLLRRVQGSQAAAQGVVATDPLHPQKRRIDGVVAQRGDVYVSFGADQQRQHERAREVALSRRVRTGVRERAVRDPSVKQPGLLEVVDEERKLPERGYRFLRCTLNMDLSGEGIDCRRPPLAIRRLNRRAISRWVSALHFPRVAHSRRIPRLKASPYAHDCGIYVDTVLPFARAVGIVSTAQS